MKKQKTLNELLATNEKDLSQQFHQSSKLRKLSRELPPDRWPDSWKRILYKSYPRFEEIKLPYPRIPTTISITQALGKRYSTRKFSEKPVSLDQLSTLLYYSAGLRNNEGTRRFYPSAGFRYPLEVYIASLNTDLEDYFYHYYVNNHSLEKLVSIERKKFFSCFNQSWIKNSGLIVIISAVFSRTTIKYGSRGYRHILAESGHLAHNFSLIQTTIGLGSCEVGGYRDDGLNDLLDLDGKNETVVCVMGFGNKEQTTNILPISKHNSSPLQQLPPKQLKKLATHPPIPLRFKVSYDNVEFNFSNRFLLDEQRQAVVCRTEQKGKTGLCVYYLSNSHGIWRYVPGIIMKNNRLYFDKGYSEESLALPFPLQQAFAFMCQKEKLVSSFAIRKALLELITTNSDRRYKEEVSSKGIRLAGNFYKENKTKKQILPYFSDPGQKPDFKRIVSTWQQQSLLYGQIRFNTYRSHDNTLSFTFGRDRNNRAWIASIENNSSISICGLRKEWIEGGSLTIPAFDYYTKWSCYEKDFQGPLLTGPYIDLFPHLHQHIPVIQEYLSCSSYE